MKTIEVNNVIKLLNQFYNDVILYSSPDSIDPKRFENKFERLKCKIENKTVKNKYIEWTENYGINLNLDLLDNLNLNKDHFNCLNSKLYVLVDISGSMDKAHLDSALPLIYMYKEMLSGMYTYFGIEVCVYGGKDCLNISLDKFEEIVEDYELLDMYREKVHAGTTTSLAVKKLKSIIENKTNNFVLHIADGDNWSYDSSNFGVIATLLSPLLTNYMYVELSNGPSQALYKTVQCLSDSIKHFQHLKIKDFSSLDVTKALNSFIDLIKK